MRLVVLESPFAGTSVDEVGQHVEYALAAVRDCLAHGESPIASHLLFAASGALDDASAEQREQGIAAGHAWMRAADAVVFYLDLGMSKGMLEGVAAAVRAGAVVEYRRLGGVWTQGGS